MTISRSISSTTELGMLCSLSSAKTFPLRSWNLIGRAELCSIRLALASVSKAHASLAWSCGLWELKDLGSRNGSFVDGRRLEPGEVVRVFDETRISFGHPDDAWQARCATEALEPVPLEPFPFGATAAGFEDALESIRLHFLVSATGEVTQTTIVHRSGSIPLEQRTYHAVLLVLAEAIMDDRGIVPAERGWRSMNWLKARLRMDPNAVNVAIHRARRQIEQAGVTGAHSIVEARAGFRRLGTGSVEIIRRSRVSL